MSAIKRPGKRPGKRAALLPVLSPRLSPALPLGLSLALSLALSAPFSALAAEKLSRISKGTYRLFEDGASINKVLHRGIDVSHWQGEIDWQKAANDDIDFVMLGTRYKGQVDPMFDQNARNAAKNGVGIGVYIYSYATSVEMAEAEADFVLDLIRDYPISYPVAFDAENAETLGTRSKEEITAIVNAFAKKIRDAGYYPILYANDNWLRYKLDMSALSQYDVWVAAYERTPHWENYAMWQGTESGSIDGITGGVDIDLQFKDYASVCAKDVWRQFDGEWYWYQDYVMQKDRLIYDGSHHYLLNADGTIYTGWKAVDGRTCYFDPASSGLMRTGWKKIDNHWYFFNNDGGRAGGWIYDNGWYYLNPDGIMQTGITNVGGVLYSLDQSGRMQTEGTVDYNGTTYAIDGSGAMVEYHPEEAAAESAAESSGAESAAAESTSADSTSSGVVSVESVSVENTSTEAAVPPSNAVSGSGGEVIPNGPGTTGESSAASFVQPR